MTVQSNRFQIVLPQDFTQWQWYNKPEIVHFFIHCLFKANKNDRPMENMLIKRGSFVSCLDTLKEETGLSVQQLRSCIKKLVATNELTSTSTNRYRIITILNYDNYTADQQAGNKPINRHINRQENVAMQENQGFCDSATGKSTSTSTGNYDNVNSCNEVLYNACQQTSNKPINRHINRQENVAMQENQGFCDSAIGKSTSTSTGNYDNVNNCSEVIYDTDQQTSNKQINSPINRQEQRNEKETKKAKEVFPPAPPIQEKEINKEKEKKNNVFFPLTSEKCVFNAASGEKNAQSQNEMKNDFEVLKNCEVVDFRFDRQNENENKHTHKFENDFSKQNLSSELENKFETSTQNFSTTTHQNEKNDFESQKKIDSLTAEGKFSQNENFSEKEKSCGKKEKEVFVGYVPVESWNVRLRNIKAGLIYSEWLERVAMQLEIPAYQIQTIFESFCCELEATGEHSTSTTPTADIQKHFFYWARRKKEKFFEKQKKTNNTAAMLRYYTELEKQIEAKYYGNNQ